MYTRVDAPEVVTPSYGIFDAIRQVMPQNPHWQTGVEYDSVGCLYSKIWEGWCLGAGDPEPVTDITNLTVSLTGSLADGTYTVSATAAVASGSRQVSWRFREFKIGDEQFTTTGQSVQTSSDIPFSGEVILKDVLTGTIGRWPVVQNEDGTLAEPTSDVVMAVPSAGVPDGCESVTVEVSTAAAADPDTGITVSVTASGSATGNRVVVVGGYRIVLADGEMTGSLTVPVGIGPGVWLFSVADEDSGSRGIGWIYIGEDSTGSATLTIPLCAVKGIGQSPWQTMFAEPFTVYAEVSCSSMGFDDPEGAADRALLASCARAVEEGVWARFVDSGRVLGSGFGVIDAIGQLERYLAREYNGVGVIHVPVEVLPYLTDINYVVDDGGNLRTRRGTLLVVGSGYGGEVSEGNFPAMIATGNMYLLVSKTNVYEVFAKETNTRQALAEKTVVPVVDCPQPGIVYLCPPQGCQ